MLWKITLLFFCALYYANGKSLKNDPELAEFLSSFSTNQEINVDALKPQNIQDGEKIELENFEELFDEIHQVQGEKQNDNDDVKLTQNLKAGYFPSHQQNQQYNHIVQKKAQVHRLPFELKNFISQLPRSGIQPFSKILNQDNKKHSQQNTNDRAQFQRVYKTDNIFDQFHDELNIIESDQRANIPNQYQSPNQIPQMLQKFSKIIPNFKPDQIFSPKINHNFKIPKSQNDDAKVGIGQFGSSIAKLKVASLTEYMKKAITNAQVQLRKLGPSITAHNPPLVINEIPNCPIFLTLKKVEGAHSIAPNGESKGIYYNKMYAFTQFKFTQLKYDYDVQIKPFNLFTINQKMNIVLTEPPTKMQVSIEKEKKIDVLHFEFVDPKVSVTFETNMLVNWALNYIINNSHPVIKNKITEIVSRDSKLMLEDFVKKAN